MWNPEKAKPTQFKTNRTESCTAILNLRVPPSLKKKLKKVEGWQDKVRALLEQEAKQVS